MPTSGATQQIPDPPGTYSGYAATTYSTVNPACWTGGFSVGFWKNKNGQDLLTQNDFSTLTELNLRTANGESQDFTSSLGDKEAFSRWLSGAESTNMAYMLSAQLAATVLNVSHGFVNATASVNAYLISSDFNTFGSSSALINALNSGPASLVDKFGQIPISALINAANTSLGTNPNTPAGSAARSYQEALKDVLNAINNNQRIILQGACNSSPPIEINDCPSPCWDGGDNQNDS